MLLRRARRSIDPQITALGWFVRLESRVGRPVTQEEVAEASQISRQWYARLERDLPVNASVAVLDRIANVLMLSDLARNELFDLTIPRLALAGAPRAAAPAGESIEFLSVTATRLSSAQSSLDALLITADALARLIRIVRDDMDGDTRTPARESASLAD